jgi:hypothetical protein
MSRILYSTENVRPWNPETDEYEDLKNAQEESEIQEMIEEGLALELLKGSRGFQVIEKYLSMSIEQLKAKLAVEEDFRKIRRLQEAVKAYTNVLVLVDYKINEGRALSTKRDPDQG